VPLLDIAAIRELLPHRFPFLLVDRIVELTDDRIVGIKNVTVNEPFFTGHFPDYAVMPGVLIVEAMAQVAGVLVLGKIPDRSNKLVFLAGVDGARFRRPVVPGDQLRLEIQLVHGRPTRAKMDGKAYVDGHLVAEASLMCVLQDRGGKPTSSE
jgi:beta-hydroxyacyl-ACP dehydratase FabZ